MKRIIFTLFLSFLIGLPLQTFAEQSKEELAKAAQNPIANMISVPFQNNTNFGIGPDDETQNSLQIQPVWPITLNEDWNLITRTILPVLYQPDFYTGKGNKWGLGDINFTAFFSPTDSGNMTWGVGPIAIFPTASDDTMGAEKWSIGPSVVALTTTDNWVVGALIYNVWSYAGESDRDSVNSLLFQYFANYNMDDGWYLVTAPIITANWEAENSSDVWNVPFGLGVGKITKWGNQPVNLSAHAYYNVEKPENAAGYAPKILDMVVMWS